MDHSLFGSNDMNICLIPALAQRCISRLVCSAMLAAAICAFPVQAHIGISEEIEAVTVRLQDDPDAPELYLLRGDLHRINGHWSEAIADFSKAQQLDRGNALADLGMGRTWLDRGQYRKALKYLDRALVLQADNVRALATRARALRLTGKPLAAAADYARAIETFKYPNTPLPEYYFECARALEAAGADYIDAAIEILDAGTGRLGKLRILEDYAIELERMRGNYPAALQRLDGIIARSARKESLLVRRADIQLQAGQPAQAEADIAAARAALDALPAQRRHSRAMQQLRADIDRRLPGAEAARWPGITPCDARYACRCP